MFQTNNMITIFWHFLWHCFCITSEPLRASQGARCTPPAPAQLSLAWEPPVPRRLQGLRGVAPTNRGAPQLEVVFETKSKDVNYVNYICNKNLPIVFGIHSI